MKNKKLLEQMINKYNLVNNQKITKEKLQQIATQEEILLKDLVFLLGCYKNIVYKSEKMWTKINLLKHSESNIDKVKLIKLDLKYLKEYGSKFYKYEEINSICKYYNLDINFFLKKLYYNKVSYFDNLEILKNNTKGIYIGEKTRLSKKFIKENYDILYKKIQSIAKYLAYSYGYYELKDDLLDIGLNSIIEFGNIEKNFSYNKEKVLNKMVCRTRYIMLNELLSKYRFMYNEDILISDSNLYMREKNNVYGWLENVIFKKEQVLLINELMRNLDSLICDRQNTFKLICKKMKIDKKKLYDIIKSIRIVLINNKKVRITKRNEVLIINE